MLYGTQYSIIQHIEKHFPELTSVEWVYDGYKRPSADQRPYATVDNLFNDTEVLSKDITARTTFRFQIELCTDSNVQNVRFTDRLRKVLIHEPITLYTIDENDVPSAVGTIGVSINGETPIHPEGVDEISEYHRTFFDISVSITFNK